MEITHNTFWYWDSVLDKKECEFILKNIDNKKFQPAGITKDNKVDENTRVTDIYWLDVFSTVGCVLQAYINAANHYAGWDFKLRYMEKVQIGKYTEDKDSFYDWHIDTNVPDQNQEQRKLSIALLLSDPKDFEGGKLELKELDKEQNNKILKTQGSIVVFPSFMEHKVTPVTKGTRYTAVSWMSGPKFI